jgi:arginine utilization protein RocB
VLTSGQRNAENEDAPTGGRHSDERQRALAHIRSLHAQLPPGRPLVVVSLLPPFYPAQLNAADNAATAKLIELTRAHGLTHRRVYPYIADLSYFAFSEKSVAGWEANAPLWFDAAELADLQAAATPVCNLGPWGAGAHNETERVYLPYLCDKLPRIISEALHKLAGYLCS